MDRACLLKKAQARKKQMGITLKNISSITNLGYKTVTRFFAGDNVRLNTCEKISSLLGLDIRGNEVIDIDTLINKRAKQKAFYIISLVQDISSLEMQGLEPEDINTLLQETKQKFLTGEYKNTLWTE